ncbi:hypothetical protein KRMM14A1259_08550 [Krasilnikovia sp. MM14-A1259]
MNLDMISIPAGQITLSDRRTQTHWTVELAPYRLAAHPVTRALHTRITAGHPHPHRTADCPSPTCPGWTPSASATPCPTTRA